MDTQQLMASAREQLMKFYNDPEALAKFTVQASTGLYGYSLEMPAKQLVPSLPGPEKLIPRRTIPTGFDHHYKKITGVTQTGGMGAVDGKRGMNGSITVNTAGTVTFGKLSSGKFDVTFDAQKVGGTAQDALATATSLQLINALRGEQAYILGGNIYPLKVPTLTAAELTSVTGTLNNAATYYCYVRAMSLPAVQKAILTGGWAEPDASDKSFDPANLSSLAIDILTGFGAPSTVSSVATPAATSSIHLTWDAIKGAAGYGLFIGTTTGITNAAFVGVVGQTDVVVKTVPTTGTKASSTTAYTDGYGTARTFDTTVDTSAENSTMFSDPNALVYEGMLSQITGMTSVAGTYSATGAYLVNLGAKLSNANGYGIKEINDALRAVYLKQLGVDDVEIWVGSGEMNNIARAFGAGATSTVVRLNADLGAEEQRAATAGFRVQYYFHPVTGRKIPIVVDPNFWQGMIVIVPKSVPYPNSNIDSPTVLWMNYDWSQFEYKFYEPATAYELQIRAGLAMYTPLAYAIIYNIYNG